MLNTARVRRLEGTKLWEKLTTRSSSSPFYLLAGTNVIEEDEAILMTIAEHVKRITEKIGIPVVFKASWDKANRTSGDGFRGIGMQRGLERLSKVKKEFELPVLTDVHEVGQVQAVSMVADILQIPSFLCRQTDLITSAAKSGRIVNLKRGQFASAGVMNHAVTKARSAGAQHVMVCERGLMFGLHDLVFDPRQLADLKSACDASVVCDVTHCAQKPPSCDTNNSHSSGNRDMVSVVARAAVATGNVDGIFIELHPDPENASVDKDVQYPLDGLEPLLKTLIDIGRITLM